VDEGVARRHAIAETVGHSLENAWYGIPFSVDRQPEAGGQPRAVPQLDPLVVDLAHGAWPILVPCHAATSQPKVHKVSESRVYWARSVSGNGAASPGGHAGAGDRRVNYSHSMAARTEADLARTGLTVEEV
jgi:hypothetical protein